MFIHTLLITSEWIEYLEKRGLSKQYKKAKQYLLAWNYTHIDFALREPKKDRIYYFRVNKQFRVIGYIEEWVFKVIKIDNHQQ